MGGKTGVLFVGMSGATANTTLMGARLVAEGHAPRRGLMTDHERFDRFDLVPPSSRASLPRTPISGIALEKASTSPASQYS